VTGTASPSEAQQHGIEKGKLEGQKLTFEETEGLTPLVFDLAFDGESIQGKMSGHTDGHSRSTRLHLKRNTAVAASDDRSADRAAIRAHIDRIFQAFIRQDAAELRPTHAANWLGYLEGSRQHDPRAGWPCGGSAWMPRS